MTENTFLTRYDKGGAFRCIAYAEGYVMVRRKGASPCCMALDKWLKMSVKPIEEECKKDTPAQ